MDISLSNISVMQIITFITVAEQKGFAKAADELHMTQSAVTKSIAKLESELDMKLFLRTTRSVSLSEAGSALYHTWKPCLKQMQNCFHATYSQVKQDDKTIHIALINTTAGSRYFADLAQQFQKKYPHIELNIVGDSLVNQWEFLKQHKYDIIFIPDFEHYELDRLQLPWKWVAQSPAQVYVSPEHPLAQHTSLKLSHIKSELHVILDDVQNPNYLRSLREMYATAKIIPHIGKRYYTTDTIHSLLKFEGILLVDDYFDPRNLKDFVKIPLEDLKNGIICTWNTPYRTKYIKYFLDLI